MANRSVKVLSRIYAPKKKENVPQSNKGICNYVLHAHKHLRHAQPGHDVSEDKHTDATGHAACEAREAEEQHDARLPRNTRSTVAERVGTQARLLDTVDDEHAQAREDEGQPVDKGDVCVGRVEWGLGPHCGIEKNVECKRELQDQTASVERR